jgi:hypothetical protein
MKMIPTVLKVDVTTTAARVSATDLWVKWAVFKAALANAGNIALGASNAVTIATGHQLDAAQELPIDLLGKSTEGINLKDLWVISSEATGDDLLVTYLVETGV